MPQYSTHATGYKIKSVSKSVKSSALRTVVMAAVNHRFNGNRRQPVGAESRLPLILMRRAIRRNRWAQSRQKKHCARQFTTRVSVMDLFTPSIEVLMNTPPPHTDSGTLQWRIKKNWKRDRTKWITPVTIHGKCTQRTICLLYGKRRLFGKTNPPLEHSRVPLLQLVDLGVSGGNETHKSGRLRTLLTKKNLYRTVGSTIAERLRDVLQHVNSETNLIQFI